MLTNFTYRPAVPSDALTLSALATQVFFDTYATNGIDTNLATEALNVYSQSIFEARLVNPDLEIIAVESDKHLIGFIDLCKTTRCPIRPVAGPEVFRLYIQSCFQRRGIGRQLLFLAEASAARMGAEMVWLAVWSGNKSALSFYTSIGYNDIGATQYAIHGKLYENRVLAKQLFVGL